LNGRTRAAVAVVGMLILGAAAPWWWTRSGSNVPPTRDTDTAIAGTAPRLALQLEVLSAGPDDDTVVVVRPFDAGRVQKNAIEAAERASGREWNSRTRAQRLAAPPANPPDNWTEQVTLTSTLNGAVTTLTRRVVPTREPGVGMFLVRAPAGARLAASLPFLGATVRSNTVTTRVLVDATEIAVAQGRAAEVLGHADAVRAAGAALLARDANSVWGDYFRGAALELDGDRAGARAAYERAVSHVVPGYEPPLGLSLRIDRLK
jgi:hypothetical protein